MFPKICLLAVTLIILETPKTTSELTLEISDLTDALKIIDYPVCHSAYLHYQQHCTRHMYTSVIRHIHSINFSKPEFCCPYWSYLRCVKEATLSDANCANDTIQAAYNASFRMLEYQTREISCIPETTGCSNGTSTLERTLRQTMELIFSLIAVLLQLYLAK